MQPTSNWSLKVKQEIESQINPTEFVQDIKKLTKSKNPQVALSALKTIADIQSIGKTTLELPPMIILTMPAPSQPTSLDQYVNRTVLEAGEESVD